MTVSNEIIAVILSVYVLQGHICTTDLGVALLPSQAIPCMVKIAEECPLFGLRGVAFFALNLTAQSLTGAERLAQLGWYSNAGWSPAAPAVSAAPARNITPVEDRYLLRLPCASVDNISTVSDSSSVPSTPFKTTPSLKTLHKKCVDPDIGRKTSSGNPDFCTISVISCVSCELCRLFDVSSSVLNPTAATTPTSDGCSCPVHGRFIGDDQSSSTYCIPLSVRCTAAEQSDDDDLQTPTTVHQRKTTRSKSVGASEHDPGGEDTVPTRSPRALMYMKKACESNTERVKSSTMPNNSSASMLSRTFPSAHCRSFSFGGGHLPEEQCHSVAAASTAEFSWTLEPDDSYRSEIGNFVRTSAQRSPSMSLYKAPEKSPDSSNLMRGRLGFRKLARKSRGLPTIGYDRRNGARDVFAETVTDSDVDGIQKWRVLQTERALSEDLTPKFHADVVLEDEAYESPSKFFK